MTLRCEWVAAALGRCAGIVAVAVVSACRAPTSVPPRPVVAQPSMPDVEAAPAADVAPLEIAAGSSHACARRGDGTVACWGDNRQGQLGDGTFVSRAQPVVVPGLDDVEAIGAGSLHTCAVRASGTVVCWGDNRLGQVGPGDRRSRTQPTEVPGIDDAVAVFGTRRRSCAVLEDGTMQCWGLHAPEPVAVDGLKKVVSACGDGDLFGDWLCALQDDGEVSCAVGSLDSMRPHISDATQLACDADGLACVLVSDGTMHCLDPGAGAPVLVLDAATHLVGGCGRAADGWHCMMQGAQGPAIRSELGPDASDLVLVGPRSYCATSPGGALACFGDARPGRRTEDLPWIASTTVQGLASSTGLTEYGADVCGRDASGTETCFDGDGEPRAASGSSPASTRRCSLGARGRPQCDDAPVKGVGRVREVVEPNLSFSSGKACGLTPAGEVRCWALDSDDPGVWSVPQVHDAETLIVSRNHGCVRYGDGRVDCWRDGAPAHFTPVSDAEDLAGGGERFCARLEDGHVACWGRLVAFESLCDRGAPRTAATESASAIVGIDDAIAIAVGPFEGCALERNGAVSCWDGFLGWPSCGVDAAVVARRVAMVPGATDIAVGHGMVCARGDDGGVQCFWGREDRQTAAAVAEPRRVARLDGAVELVLGRLACARFDDGRVRCSHEHDALLRTRFFEVEALEDHRLRDGGTTLIGFEDTDVVFVGSFGERSAELPSPVVDLVSREGVTCALLDAGEVWCTPPGVEFAFEHDPPPEPAAQLGTDGDSVCAIAASGAAWCRTFAATWKPLAAGTVGRIQGDLGGTCRVVGADTICDVTPSGWSMRVGAMPANTITRMPGVTILDAAFGGEHRCVLRSDGRVECWGEASRGQLGTGDLEARSDPTPVVDLHDVEAIEVAGKSSCALTKDRQVWCWGDVGQPSALELVELDALWTRALR